MFTISNLFIYSLICSVGLLLMYGAIRLSKVSFTAYGRVVILSSVLTIVVASAVPLLLGWQSRSVMYVENSVSPMDFHMAIAADNQAVDKVESLACSLNWWTVVSYVYIIGMIVAFCRLLITIVRIIALILRSERGNGVMLSRQDDIVPFTWGGHIIMTRSDYESDGEVLLAHESAHKRANHWLDLLFINLLGCLTWYCPAARMIRHELQSTHEFTADRAVIAAGFDAKEYQMLLISKASGRRFANSVVDCINNHSLKSRIIMMQKKSPMRHWLLRSLTLVPAAFTFIALASSPALASMIGSSMPAKVIVSEQKETSADNPKIYVDGNLVESLDSYDPNDIESITMIKTDGRNDLIVTTKSKTDEKKSTESVESDEAQSPRTEVLTFPENVRVRERSADKGTVVNYYPSQPVKVTTKESKEEKVFTKVEESPRFKGGDAEMYKFLTLNMRYPEEAAKKNIQGRVIVQFVVKKDGSIGDVKVVRGVDPELDAEAIRVIKLMPDFEPGKMNGEPVNVWYTLPLNFKMQ